MNRPALPAGLRHTFAALKHPNYRLWFAGQLVSLVGTWMQTTAQGYLVYQLTQSPEFLGYVSFAAGLPSWLFTLYAGAIADRLSRRALMVITQTVMMGLAFLLAGLVFAGMVQPWHILALAFCLGVANAFDAPARISFVAELVSREDMTNAIALNSTMFNAATVVGPVVAGFTYAAFGPAWCFTLNGLSFLAVIVALGLMKLRPIARPPRTTSTWHDIKMGLAYVGSHREVRLLMTAVGVVSLFGVGMVALIPAWAVNILRGDVTTNGFLLTARGVGALIGALMIAALGRYRIKGKLWLAGSFALPVLLALFALTRELPLALLMLVGVGWSFMLFINTSNALIQNLVPDLLRGRVMSIYTLIFFGGMPVGALLLGLLAKSTSEPLAVLLYAAALLVFAGAAWFGMPALRKLE